MIKSFVYLIFTLSVLSTSAQIKSDLRIANNYANKGQCNEAIELYESLKSKVSFQSIYNNYYNCLLKEERYSKAIELVKEAQKLYPNQIRYCADLGLVYKAKGENYKAQKEFKKSIESLSPGRTNDVNTLALIFSKNGETQWLKKTFQIGQELNPNFEFGFQYATSLENLGETEQMIGIYLDLIEKNSNHLNTVKIRLQNSLGRTQSNSQNYDLLQKILLLRVQKNNNTDLTELLVWLYIQTNQYDAAYIYTKALDKRLQENGQRMYDLAFVAYENKAYESAIKCYQYVLDLGSNNPYYKNAKISQLIVTGEKLFQNDYTTDQLMKLNQKYQIVIDELGQGVEMAYLIKDYAKIKAYYLYQYSEAIALLEQNIKQLQKGTLQAECKLLLGDIFLVINEDWEAIIQYSQVEKDFKENPLGHEAKFRRAKVSYFQGQFDWAQAQLDVLKASTTKLIANNAMQLSLFITDNMGLDTSASAMQMYAKAEWLEFQNKIDDSQECLDSMLSMYQGHPLTDEIYYKKALLSIKKRDYNNAALFFEKVATNFSFDLLADDALFQWAELLENRLNNKEKAQELYQKIVLDYSDSIYTKEARKRFRNLRGDQNIEL